MIEDKRGGFWSKTGTVVKYSWKFGLFRIGLWILLLVAIFSMEVSQSIFWIIPIPIPGSWVTGAILFVIFAVGIFFRSGFAFKLLAVIGIILAVTSFVPSLPGPLIYLTQGQWARYALIFVILFYFLFRKKRLLGVA